MRIIIMFDLPVETSTQRKAYAQFRKYLLKNGFMMLQESIYCKLAQNSTVGDAIVSGVKKNKPPEGLVQAIRITEKQFAKMDCIVGTFKTEVLNTDERLVIL